VAVTTLGQAVAWAGIALTHNVWASALLLAVAGGCSALCTVVIGSTRHRLTPDRLMARVVTSSRFFGLGAVTFGTLIGGFIAHQCGLTAPLVAASGVLACATMIASAGSRSRRRGRARPETDWAHLDNSPRQASPMGSYQPTPPQTVLPPETAKAA
jgi:MFS family permease